MDCQTGHLGKGVVFSAQWKGQGVFVKGQSATLNGAHGPLKAYTLDENGRKVYPDLDDFEIMAENFLKDNLGIVLQVWCMYRTTLECLNVLTIL